VANDTMSIKCQYKVVVPYIHDSDPIVAAQEMAALMQKLVELKAQRLQLRR